MIVYSASREEFTRHVHLNVIEERVLAALKKRLGHTVSPREVEAFKNSLLYMNNVLVSNDIPRDAGVAIEYKVPLTSRRVDFILTGKDEHNQDTAVIVELKQWTTVDATRKDAIVRTYVGGGQREMVHPSYQAWTYASLIRDFNQAVQEGPIELRPCAYLHNCTSGDVLNSEFYAEHTAKAPAFVRADVTRLGKFLRQYVRYGDRGKVLYRIENGRLRPSKSLVDHLLRLMQGNREFQLIDDQKLVYETALSLAKKAQTGRKQVLIVQGGPGTGKSVVAINLLVQLTAKGLLAHYVTRNSAPRQVYEQMLAGTARRTRITNLFKGPGAYTDADANGMDALMIDEAHRLNEKSGLYQNLGIHQIMELIRATRFSVFFIDEEQQVTVKDIGSREEIRKWARHCDADVVETQLASQFRCNGSDGYLAWVNNTLQINETANTTLDGVDYDCRVFDSPNELHDLIVELNRTANKARLVAGYCWDWKGKKDPSVHDIVIPEHHFSRRWNLNEHGGLWIVKPDSVHEVGCIHTSQGLELDHVGVIIGPDFVVRDGVVITDFRRRHWRDRSIHGLKKLAKSNPEEAAEVADRIIKNTYRTLMTRGQKSCYLFCVDPETNEYFKHRARRIDSPTPLLSRERLVAEAAAEYCEASNSDEV